MLPTIVSNHVLAAAELTKQTLDLKEVFDVSRVPHPELPDTDPLNKTIEGFNLWPPGQVRASALAVTCLALPCCPSYLRLQDPTSSLLCKRTSQAAG